MIDSPDESLQPDFPEGVFHYDRVDEVPPEIKKYARIAEYGDEANHESYWRQRYTLFSKYDEGIWMTKDSWFGVTAEPVAM